MERAN